MHLKHSYSSPNKLNRLRKVSIAALFHLLHHSDYDGLVHIDFYNYNKHMQLMYKTSAFEAINDLVCHGFFTWKDGQLYSLCYHDYFREPSNENSRYQYIPTLEVFLSPRFMNLTKRSMIFLIYILSSKKYGQNHKVLIENLYRNKLHKKNTGIDIFYNYEEIKRWLTELIKEGYIIINLDNIKLTLNKETKDIQKELDHYCNKDLRKVRCSNNNTHPLTISLAPEICNKVKNSVGHTGDLYKFANMYNCFVDTNCKEVTSLYDIKKELYKSFGTDGVQIYRQALESYFKDQGYCFWEQIRDDKVTNCFRNFYIDPLVTNKLKEIVKDIISSFTDPVNVQENKLSQSEPYINFARSYFHQDLIFDLDCFIHDNILSEGIREGTFYSVLKHVSDSWSDFETYLLSVREFYINKYNHLNEKEIPNHIRLEIKRRKRERQQYKPFEFPLEDWLNYTPNE